MLSLDRILDILGPKKLQGYWANRGVSELEYLRETEKFAERGCLDEIDRGARFLLEKDEQEGAITKEAVLTLEEMLSPLAVKAKERTLLCAAHAHIDMNWMWRYDETVSVVLDTLRTMLDLLREYPQFRFSQSQASVYRIVERYAPEMLEEIRQRVREGRWEVSAATWVEADKNLPSGESHARQLLYAKRYLSELLELPAERIVMDFEPDTFGHSENVPELLSHAGIRYYYHCRGRNGRTLYRWQAPSGETVLAYCDPSYYAGEINASVVMTMPQFCRDTGCSTMLYVYGVGDHGGGPSRRDIETILDMNTWPLFPQIRCGTYAEFFREAEKVQDSLPLIRGEAGFIFTGCYSSQTRIKAANRTAETALGEAELFCGINTLQGGKPYPAHTFFRAWEKVLFNHFHDIVTGSGTIDTREYALGQFQKAMAAATTEKTAALRAIAERIDTAAYAEEDDRAVLTTSAGAGVASGIADFKVSQVSRGSGLTRVYTVFNPSLFDRQEPVEIEIWNYEGNIGRIHFLDEQGSEVPYQLYGPQPAYSWGGQSCYRALLWAKVPACGYSTYVLQPHDGWVNRFWYTPAGRTDDVPDYTLENDRIRVGFDPVTAAVISYVDKKTGQEYISRPAGIFRYIEENTLNGMTSWRVGPYMNIEDIRENVVIRQVQHGCPLRNTLEFDASFRHSTLHVAVSLDKDSEALRYDVTCQWREFGEPNVKIPQLGFCFPFAYACDTYRYDVPFGVVSRPACADDRPASSFVLAVNPAKEEKSFFLTGHTAQGFRACDNALSLTLIRSSYDPDPYPEIGEHKMSFTVGLAASATNRETVDAITALHHPMSVLSVKPSAGDLPRTGSFLRLLPGSTAAVSGIKMPEDGSGRQLLVRLYETDGAATRAELELPLAIRRARFTDILENSAEEDGPVFDGTRLTIPLKPHAVASVCIEF